ncbi:hypothetical protein [Streptomyces sp. NPDC006610]|uniref:hypothetical protein n=1 Tax=Streptomyces sp. NPDC006610 TaxID=3154584 RepID=UPI00339E5511
MGLLVWVTVAHPEGSDQAWGVVGAVAGVAALGVALWQLRASVAGPASAGAPVAPSASGPVEQVVGERGAIVARGSVRGSSTRYVGPASAAPGASSQGGGPGLVGSDGAIVAGEDVEDSRTEYRP